MDIRPDTRLGRYLTLWDLCTCTDTYRRFAKAIQPLPVVPESLEALQQMAEALLDPLIDHFGQERFQLTYGFCSHDLRRHLLDKDPETGKPFGRIYPKVDQHMSLERGVKSGKPICDHPGAACDFRVRDLDSRDLVDWILDRGLPFDSLYFYGPDRPIHLSHGPAHRRAVWTFNSANVPTTKGIEDWVQRARVLRPNPSVP